MHLGVYESAFTPTSPWGGRGGFRKEQGSSPRVGLELFLSLLLSPASVAEHCHRKKQKMTEQEAPRCVESSSSLKPSLRHVILFN